MPKERRQTRQKGLNNVHRVSLEGYFDRPGNVPTTDTLTPSYLRYTPLLQVKSIQLYDSTINSRLVYRKSWGVATPRLPIR
jgi:hypothetical protein